jgi:hypothetical protein
MSDNPLSEASPQSLDHLFSSDPLTWTNEDLDKIIEHERAMRKHWIAVQIDKENGVKPVKAVRKKIQTPKESVADLGDLDL